MSIDEGQSLGDILADALKNRNRDMMKKVEFTLVSYSEEMIDSIKDIRDAIPGVSLTSAKHMYEATSMGGVVRDAQCRVRVSMEQFGNLASFIATDTHNRLGYTGVKIIEPEERPTFDLTVSSL